MQEVAGQIDGVDTAIGETDAEAVARAVAGLERRQIAMLRVEETTRELASGLRCYDPERRDAQSAAEQYDAGMLIACSLITTLWARSTGASFR